METRIERIKKQLHSSSYKLTPQREATVRVLLENEEDHLSAEDVYLLVKEKSPEIGLATVYRTLELLTELKIVDKINFGDGVSRYDLTYKKVQHIFTIILFVLNVEQLMKFKKIFLKMLKQQLNENGILRLKIIALHSMESVIDAREKNDELK